MEKKEEEVIRKKVVIKQLVAIRRCPPDGRTQKFTSAFKHRPHRLETSMDDYVAAVTVAVAAYRRRKQRIKNINKLALVLGLLDEEDAVVSREHICSLCNVVVQQLRPRYILLDAVGGRLHDTV